MKKNTSRHRQQGQATIELCLVLLPLMFVIIAIIFFGGIGITSIKTLLKGREDAEAIASGTNSGTVGQNPILDWNYTDARYSATEKLEIPFLANDKPTQGMGIFDASTLSSPLPSLGFQDGSYDYRPLAEVLNVYNPRVDYGNSFDVAGLVFSNGDLPDEVNRNEEFYTLRKLKDSGRLKQALKDQGWFDFTTIKIRNWRSNQSAYPAFYPQDTSLLNKEQ